MTDLLLAAHYPTVPLRDATQALPRPEQLLAIANEDGYLYLPGLLDPAAIAAVRALVRHRCEALGWVLPAPDNPSTWQAKPGVRLTGRGWDDPDWIDLQREVGAHPDFLALVHSPQLLGVLKTLYGEPAGVAVANHCWIKLPGSPEHTTRPHRDAFYLPDCPRMWTAWLPLTDTPAEVGPLGVVPGSHTLGQWPQRDAMQGIDVPREATWATGPVVPGDVVLFGAQAIHCAWANTSATAVRVSLDVRFEPLSTVGSILRPGM